MFIIQVVGLLLRPIVAASTALLIGRGCCDGGMVCARQSLVAAAAFLTSSKSSSVVHRYNNDRILSLLRQHRATTRTTPVKTRQVSSVAAAAAATLVTAHRGGGTASAAATTTTDSSAAGMSSLSDPTKYWNRETSVKQNYDSQLPIVKRAKIVALTEADHDANSPLLDLKGDAAELVYMGTSPTERDLERFVEEGVNVVFISSCDGCRETLARLLRALPPDSVQWIHARSAGIDFATSPALQTDWHDAGIMTNAKGQFSSTLAEYTVLACTYFAKDVPQLTRNHRSRSWHKYSVRELRGSTLGVVGYGDIGRAAAKLCKAMGMRVVAMQKRRPVDPEADPALRLCDEYYVADERSDALEMILKQSDYILCATPLTPDTLGMLGEEQFNVVKPGAVLINVGRGPVVDQDAMIRALQRPERAGRRRLRGAALDVFETEPLPEDSPLWDMDDRVLLSPHNMDQTETFMREATEFFVEENLPRFVRGLPLLNRVNRKAGY